MRSTKRTSLWVAGLAALLLAWLGLSYGVAQTALRRDAAQAVDRQSHALERSADSLARSVSNALRELHAMPALIASTPNVIHAARGTAQLAAVPLTGRKKIWSEDTELQALNRYFATAAEAFGVDVIWLMNPSGDCFAASNAASSISFVGMNYADRAYFKAGMAGGRGYQFAVGRASNIPGLFFSAPVHLADASIGIVAVKIDLARMAYLLSQVEAFVTDDQGVIILASQRDLAMRSVPGATVHQLDEAARLARYKRAHFEPLAIEPFGSAELPTLQQFAGEGRPLQLARRAIAGDGLNIYVIDHFNQLTQLRHDRSGTFFLMATTGWAFLLVSGGALIVSRTRKRAALEMANSLSLLDATLESTSDAILVVDRSGQVTMFNRRFIEFWRIPAELQTIRADSKLLEHVCGQLQDPQLFIAKVMELYEHPDKNSHDTLQFADGRVFERDSYPQRAGEQIVGRVWNFRDITDRQRAEEALRIAATAFESQEGMIVTDSQAKILQANQAFQALTGYAASELVGQTPALLKSGRHDAAFYENMWSELLSSGSWKGEIWNRHKDGQIYPEWLVVTAVKRADAVVTHYVGAFTDITLRKEAEAKIRTLAFYDALTQLPNRRLMMDRLGQAIITSGRRQRHAALMFLDLDNFKSLNDTAGHEVGDQLLIEVATRLRSAVRESDTVSRLGGDEFVILVEDLDSAQALAAAHAEIVGNKIQEALCTPMVLHGKSGATVSDFVVTASVGICLFLGHEATIDELLKRADVAMYQAKAAGRSTARFFDPDMQHALDARSAMQSELRHALARGEFQLLYQLQFDANAAPVGAEALIRWNHPRRGVVLPDEFIPLAEDSGLIVPIGLWVLEVACKQLTSWAAVPGQHGLRMAVNLSPRQFRRPDFVAQVRSVLERTGANPERLTLELTENLVIENVPDTTAKMHELKRIGVGFALDDFGTGSSSLAYLRQLPLDQLKIDRSFVIDLERVPSNAAICAAIISLAHNLGLKVVAEGVETVAQREFLADKNGCDWLQGHLFARPQDSSAIERALNHAARPNAAEPTCA